MPKISILPEEIRGKIAAGEVVERPASVVKELVENSFDAQASYIRVVLKEGGLREIAVYDDGEGMDLEDLKVCYHHFATSKIKNLADIFRVVTYGFRGEALASIAQVSRMNIASLREGQEIAYQIEIEAGKEVGIKPVPLKKGTLVVVKDLFFNLPARKAFLKSPRTETLKVLEVFKGLCLSHPELKFELKIQDEKEKVLFSWEGGSLIGLLQKITGIEQKHFQEIRLENPPYVVELTLTDTSYTLPHTRYLWVFVNQRWIKDEKLVKMLINAFKPFYGNLGFPAGVVSIKVPYHLVDVNVHPAKWEVRFKDERALHHLLALALEKIFAEKKTFYRPTFSEEGLKVKEDLPLDYTECSKTIFYPRKEGSTFRELNLSTFRSRDFKYLGTFQQTYFLVEKEDKLYLIDQHALSERLIFEELREKYKKGGSQSCLFSLPLRLSPDGFVNFQNQRKVLEEIGFGFEVSEEKVFLTKVPTVFKEDVRELLEELLEGGFLDPKVLLKEVLAGYACRLARKKGDFLSENEVYELLEVFFEKKVQTCPHGRPLYWVIEAYEIEKRLRRKV
ncbi:DNA mismatch repair endonuclease MutL [Thermodesulfobacterium sp. TA1]|uniref:DNA mismatch repair endonuclease MutL n=1 Tax=Thermodesulfobacterium sp. TA1 TaxID=2234087 RepID=UPI001232B575|nr:DNA mismatch repair endonuclease MutL [Thermodesulfobacterium sp. TA1]QER41506.1 DNA mismatch repair endonuclease MutL [Thermodesulfobacterium sp. TA1]